MGIEAMVEDPNKVEAVVMFPKGIEYMLLVDAEAMAVADADEAATTSNLEADGDGGYPIAVFVVDVDDIVVDP